MVLVGMLAGCTNSNKQTTNNDMDEKLELTQEWDKVFPLSEKVNHQKVTFFRLVTLEEASLCAERITPPPTSANYMLSLRISVTSDFVRFR